MSDQGATGSRGVRNRARAGSASVIAAVPTRLEIPPMAAAGPGPTSEPSTPARKLPSSGAPAPTTYSTALTRPR